MTLVTSEPRPRLFDVSRCFGTVLSVSEQWPDRPGASPPWVAPESQTVPSSGSPAAPPPPPDFSTPGGARGSRRVLVAVAIATSLVLVVAVLAVVVGHRDASRTTAIGASPSTSEVPTSTTGVTGPTSSDPGPAQRGAGGTGDPQVDAVLSDISRFVETERGLEFKAPVKVELADESTFNQKLMAGFDEDTASLVRTGNQLEALGMIPKGTDLVAKLRKLLGAGVLGFYDPKTKALVVRGTDLTPYTRQTVAHELTHALDDQWFNLDRPELDKAKDESSFGFTALVEGNARRVENAYTDTMSAKDRRDLQREEASFGEGIDLTGVPVVLVELIQAPYDFGVDLVQKILSAKGRAALDASFAKPPTTSEQVMDPDKYVSGEGAVTVPEPPADGEATDDGMLGELTLYLLLRDATGASTAHVAATGWGGDHYVSWTRSDGATCLRDDIVMETSRDLGELVGAMKTWASGRSGVQIDPSAGGVRLTACG